MNRLYDGVPDREFEPPYQAMVEAAPVAMVLVDRAGRILSVNAEAERMFRYPRAALAGQAVEILVPGAARGGHATLRDEYQSAPTTRAMGAGHELIGLRADGSEFPVEVGLNPIMPPGAPPDAMAGATRVLAVVSDMSERARAESARAYLAAIVDSSDDAIIGKTLDGTITSWNRAAETILGWPEWEIVGQSIHRIIPADRRDEEAHILARVCAGGRVEDLATVRQRRDNTLIPVSITVSPIRDRGGRVIGASKIMRDATDRHRDELAIRHANAMLELAVAERTRELAEQQEARLRAEAALAQSRRLEAVGQLTGGIAHDFNNLLTVVAGNLDLIRTQVGLGDPAFERAADSIARAVDRGARLTGHLLAFARQQSLQPQLERLDEVVRDFSLLTMRALAENVRLSIEADDDVWPCRIDRAQFESAVLNLSINARDAMPDGGMLSFRIENLVAADDGEVSPGRYVSVRVADTGAGMTKEVVGRAVEPFFTTKEVGKGSGLGLSQVYGFVQQSGGALRIESRPGEGTSITMLFPAAEPERAAVAEPARPG